jgi:hypothetical protein
MQAINMQMWWETSLKLITVYVAVVIRTGYKRNTGVTNISKVEASRMKGVNVNLQYATNADIWVQGYISIHNLNAKHL